MRSVLSIVCFMGSTLLIGVFAQEDIKNLDSREYIPRYPYPYLYTRKHQYPYTSKPGYSHNYHRYEDQQQQGFLNILESLTARDTLHCIPKILCEMASTGQDTTNSGFLNLNSLATLLSGVDDRLVSPIVKFGKAVILGYTSKQHRQCQYAYPLCPSDPDKLVYYLNNQNSEVLRLFNVNNLSSNQEDKRQYAWQFPSYDTQIHNYENNRGKVLIFPSKDKTYVRDNVQLHFPQNREEQNFVFPNDV